MNLRRSAKAAPARGNVRRNSLIQSAGASPFCASSAEAQRAQRLGHQYSRNTKATCHWSSVLREFLKVVEIQKQAESRSRGRLIPTLSNTSAPDSCVMKTGCLLLLQHPTPWRRLPSPRQVPLAVEIRSHCRYPSFISCATLRILSKAPAFSKVSSSGNSSLRFAR